MALRVRGSNQAAFQKQRHWGYQDALVRDWVPPTNILPAKDTATNATVTGLTTVAATASVAAPGLSMVEQPATVAGTTTVAQPIPKFHVESSFEGTDGATVGANADIFGGGGASSGSSTVTYSSTWARLGQTSLKFFTFDGTFVQRLVDIQPLQGKLSWYFRTDTIPTSTATLINIVDGALTPAGGLRLTNTGAWRITDATTSVGTSSASEVVVNTTYRLEWEWSTITQTQTLRVWKGTNLEGVTPDVTLTGDFNVINNIVPLTMRLGWPAGPGVQATNYWDALDFDSIVARGIAPVNAATVSATTTIGSPTVTTSGGNADVTPTTVAAVASVAAPGLSMVEQAATVAATTTVGAPTVLASSTPTPGNVDAGGLRSTVISDSFNRADGAIGTADVGGAWTVSGAAATITSNQLVIDASCDVYIDSGSSNTTLTVTWVAKGFIANGHIYPRITDSDNKIIVQHNRIGYIVGGGGFNEVATYSAIAAGSVVTVISRYSNIRVYDDGVLIADVTITALQSATKQGLGQGIAYDTTWNDFSVVKRTLVPQPTLATSTTVTGLTTVAASASVPSPGLSMVEGAATVAGAATVGAPTLAAGSTVSATTVAATTTVGAAFVQPARAATVVATATVPAPAARNITARTVAAVATVAGQWSFTDDFERADAGDGTLGNGWYKPTPAASASISGGVATVDDISYRIPSSRTYTVEYTLGTVSTGISQTFAAIEMGVSGTPYAWVRNVPGSDWVEVETTAGTLRIASFQIVTGDTIEMEVDWDDHVTLWVNGVLRGTLSNTSYDPFYPNFPTTVSPHSRLTLLNSQYQSVSVRIGLRDGSDGTIVRAGAAATPATVAATATVGAPTLAASSTITVTAVAGTASVPSPGLTTVEQAATVAAVTTIGAPTVVLPATVTPTTVLGTATVGSPSLQTATNATASPATVGPYVTIGAPTIVAGSTTLVAVIPISVTIAAPQAAGTVTTNPTVVNTVAIVSLPTFFSHATASPGTVDGASTIASVVLAGGVLVQAAVIDALAEVGVPVLTTRRTPFRGWGVPIR